MYKRQVDQWSARFSQLLECAPVGLKLLVSVICGNDWYNSKQCVDQNVLDAATQLCEGMKCKSERQLAVVGMSSSTWSYERNMSTFEQNRFDEDAAFLTSHFLSQQVIAIRGAAELVGIVPADDIGHVDCKSEAIVFSAYKQWLKFCSRAALSEEEKEEDDEDDAE